MRARRMTAAVRRCYLVANVIRCAERQRTAVLLFYGAKDYVTQPDSSPYSPPTSDGLPPPLPPVTTSTRSAPHAMWLVAFMWVAYFLNYSDRQAIFTMFPVLKRDLQFTDSQLGLIGSVFLWVYGFWMPASGLVADRFRNVGW